jgi:uncharacterized protein (TIGR02466 family)
MTVTPTGNTTLQLWPTPLGVYQWAQASEHNPLLTKVLQSIRFAQTQGHSESSGSSAFFASSDDLLQRIQIPEWTAWLQFVVHAIRDTAAAANAQAWADAGESSPGMHIRINGLWCQFSNQGVHHDIHTHGNCSWSGVYYVNIDPAAQRQAHPQLGSTNGVTRFYGPYFNRLGGAHADFGNAYLQQPHIDMVPESGKLIVFPSWLPHQAMPYSGEQDRLILSFNASIDRESGSNQMHGYARA